MKLFSTSLLFALASARFHDVPDCRCRPHQDCWPSQEEWKALNGSINGNLVAGKPAAAKDRVVVGGAYPSIGVAGGYIQAGGHSPIGAWKGLASDNTLEFQVVTANVVKPSPQWTVGLKIRI